MQRRLLTWLGCAFGVAWLLRRLRGRPPEVGADPAAELRRTLQESRDEAIATREPPAEPPAAPAPEPEPEPEVPLVERRRAVYERGRAAIDHMRGSDAPPEER
jgi:hypothetical protein